MPVNKNKPINLTSADFSFNIKIYFHCNISGPSIFFCVVDVLLSSYKSSPTYSFHILRIFTFLLSALPFFISCILSMSTLSFCFSYSYLPYVWCFCFFFAEHFLLNHSFLACLNLFVIYLRNVIYSVPYHCLSSSFHHVKNFIYRPFLFSSFWMVLSRDDLVSGWSCLGVISSAF